MHLDKGNRCFQCAAAIEEKQFFCSHLCEAEWQAEQREEQDRIDRERREELEDHNAGCWSYSW